MEHESEIAYTTDDDGIHLRCKNDGWEKVFEFDTNPSHSLWPSVLDIVAAWGTHTLSKD